MLETIISFSKPAAEIIILWVVLYRILVFFEGTRAIHVFKGIFYLLALFVICQLFALGTLNWLLTKIFGISVIAFFIIFQPELRHGLARLGQPHLFTIDLAEPELIMIIDALTSAVYKLSAKKIGCIVAIERQAKLNTCIESGIKIDSHVSTELLQSIFTPPSPLHDGGVVIRAERIIAASCLFPLSENQNFSKLIGTRHRAALGITEQTDAIVILSSEETGEISIAVDGKFIPVTNKERFVNILKELLIGKK
ncbi:MAG: diadenylate cyclase CdaA [Candidatus Omnitrophota bacterium]